MKTAAVILAALILTGCQTPLFSTAGDIGPITYRLRCDYQSPATVDLDGHLVWDGWPLRDEPGEDE
jgi:hypothetical protein